MLSTGEESIVGGIVKIEVEGRLDWDENADTWLASGVERVPVVIVDDGVLGLVGGQLV